LLIKKSPESVLGFDSTSDKDDDGRKLQAAAKLTIYSRLYEKIKRARAKMLS